MTPRRWGAVLVGAALTLGLVVTARTPDAGAGWRIAFVALHLAGTLALVRYLRVATLDAQTVLIGAVVFRLCALPLLPTLSDDGYRYLWDGRATVAGVSPYAFRPSDPALAPWHDGVLYERMNSPDYFSVYPPASQAAFALASSALPWAGWRGAWWIWKALMVTAELSAIVALLRCVGAQGAALYAWSPLAVMEIAGQGHTEALVVLGLGALLVGARSRLPLASLGATVAGAVKLYPLALLPQAWRRDGRRGVLASVLLLGACSIPLWSPEAAGHVSESLGLFFGTFDAYAAPYRLLKAALFPLAGDAAGRWASAALASVFAGAALGLALTDDGTRPSLHRALGVVVVGFALTASTLHPWYWLPVMFILPLLDSKKTILWLATWATAGYLGYVVAGVDEIATVIGWGGAAWLTVSARARSGRERRQTSPSARPSTGLRDSVGTT